MSHENPPPLTTNGVSAAHTHCLIDSGSKLKMQRESENQHSPDIVPRSFPQLCFNHNCFPLGITSNSLSLREEQSIQTQQKATGKPLVKYC